MPKEEDIQVNYLLYKISFYILIFLTICITFTFLDLLSKKILIYKCVEKGLSPIEVKILYDYENITSEDKNLFLNLISKKIEKR